MVLLCQTLEVSRSGYFAWSKRGASMRQRANARLQEDVRAVHKSSHGTYGRRRVTAELRKQGQKVSNNRVGRLMAMQGIQGKSPRKFRTTTIPNLKLENNPNLLKKNQEQLKKHDKAWVSDITYISTGEGWLYLCVILDFVSRKVVGWSVDKHLRAELVGRALQAALKERKPKSGLIFHSDCGGQYKSDLVRNLIRKHDLKQSMTFAGNCYDNYCVS